MMNLLLNQTFPIPLHVIAAMVAIILGGIQLSLKKGGVVHKTIGHIWVGLMLAVSFSSFFIHEIRLWGIYSPIHLLSLWTIIACFLAIYFVRIGSVKTHKIMMISMYFLALILTGLFTLWPGRVMHQIVFG